MLNPRVTVKVGRILGWRIFMQIRQRIFKCFIIQICRLFSTLFWNFWRITRLPLTVAELSTLKQVRFFGPPCISQGSEATHMYGGLIN